MGTKIDAAEILRRASAKGWRKVIAGSPLTEDAYVDRVSRALTFTAAEVAQLPKREYLSALERILDEIEGMIMAAQEELRAEEKGE